jgi:hypothetical protein
MAQIDLPAGVAGPRAMMVFRPETAEPLNELAEILLRGPSHYPLVTRQLSSRRASGFVLTGCSDE